MLSGLKLKDYFFSWNFPLSILNHGFDFVHEPFKILPYFVIPDLSRKIGSLDQWFSTMLYSEQHLEICQNEFSSNSVINEIQNVTIAPKKVCVMFQDNILKCSQQQSSGLQAILTLPQEALTEVEGANIGKAIETRAPCAEWQDNFWNMYLKL